MSVGICSVCGCPDRPMLHVGTVAVALDCSGRYLRKLLAAGTLKGIRIGKRCWRIDHAGLHQFLARADNRADEGILPAPSLPSRQDDEGIIPATTPQEHAA